MNIKCKKRFNEYKRGEIAKIILKGLVSGGFIVAVVAMPGLANVLTLFNPKNNRERERVKRAVYALKKQRFIKIYEKNGKEIIEITERGRKKVKEYSFEDLTIKKPKYWDKKWRVIIFDIPSGTKSKEKARKLLRLKLNDLGFIQYQKSVFICPYECRDEIDFIKKRLFIGNCVKYMLVNNIDDEYKLKKHFNL